MIDAAELISSGFAEGVQGAVQEVTHGVVGEMLLRGMIAVTLTPMSED